LKTPHFQPPPSFVDAWIPSQAAKRGCFWNELKPTQSDQKTFRDLKNAAKKMGKNGMENLTYANMNQHVHQQRYCIISDGFLFKAAAVEGKKSSPTLLIRTGTC